MVSLVGTCLFSRLVILFIFACFHVFYLVNVYFFAFSELGRREEIH